MGDKLSAGIVLGILLAVGVPVWAVAADGGRGVAQSGVVAGAPPPATGSPAGEGFQPVNADRVMCQLDQVEGGVTGPDGRVDIRNARNIVFYCKAHNARKDVRMELKVPGVKDGLIMTKNFGAIRVTGDVPHAFGMMSIEMKPADQRRLEEFLNKQ